MLPLRPLPLAVAIGEPIVVARDGDPAVLRAETKRIMGEIEALAAKARAAVDGLD